MLRATSKPLTSGRRQVEENHVGAALVRHLHGARAGVGDEDLVAHVLQQRAQDFRGVDVVVHDEDAPRFAVGIALSPAPRWD